MHSLIRRPGASPERGRTFLEARGPTLQLQLRLLPPKSYRLRNRPPEWEVTDDRGTVVGWIEEHQIPTASRPFYNLTALHPKTGEHIPLELSADIEERLAKLADFLQEPARHWMHFPSGSRARKALDARLGAPAWELRGERSGRHV